jgi:hypothetical protein
MRSRAYLLVGVWAFADSVLREDDPARSAEQPSYDTSGIEVWALEEKVDGVLRAPAGGRLFLPEETLPENFDADNQLQEWLRRIARPRLQTLVSRGLSLAMAQAGGG